jgi:hypothetical protein
MIPTGDKTTWSVTHREKWNAYMRAYQKSDRVKFRRQFKSYAEKERAKEDAWLEDKVLFGLDLEKLVLPKPLLFKSVPFKSVPCKKTKGFRYRGKWYTYDDK